jgi:spermidine synthase
MQPDDPDAERRAVPFVREALTSKTLHFSLEEVQSRMRIGRPDALDLRYTRTMMGFLLFGPAPRDIAMVGLGGGSLAKFCHRHLPQARLDVVEVNPRVIALREQFRVPPDGKRFRVIEADAAAFVRDTERRYDVLLLDGFGPRGLPPRLSTQRYYDDCADVLKADGLLVANLHSAARDFDACVDRIARSFGGGALLVEESDARNTIVFARRHGGLLKSPLRSRHELAERLGKAAWSQLDAAFERIATFAEQARDRQQGGPGAGAMDGCKAPEPPAEA